MTDTDRAPARAADEAARGSLVSLLGGPRATIVERLHRDGDASVSELAEHLGISEVAVRRHLGVLAEDGLVASRRVAGRRGRPASRYHLTAAASRLFPQGYDRFAAEVLDYLADTHGSRGLHEFLRWRLDREVAQLRTAVTAEDLHERLEQLAGALSAAGFRASVDAEGEGFTLTQEHCAIYDVAREHPEVCAVEAATFARVLGPDARIRRRQTLAGGAPACVCSITPREQAPDGARAHDTTSAGRDGAPVPTGTTAARGRSDHPGDSTSEVGRGDHQ